MATTAVANQEQKQEVGIAGFLNMPAVRANIESVVGDGASTFIAGVVSAVQTNPALAECSKGSILSSALLGESLKLSPSPQLGNYYLVPYKNKKTGGADAQFQLGYRGMIQLAVRSGQYKNIVASEVKEGEIASYNPITEEFVLNPCNDPKKRAKLPTIGYYASFELTSGFRKEIYWSKEEMQEHAKRYSSGYRQDLSKGTQYTFWSTNFDGMAKKTMLRQLISKWGIMSIDMQKAYAGDQAVIKDDGTPEYVDNIVDPVEVRDADVAEGANKKDFVDADVVSVASAEQISIVEVKK